MFVDPEFKSLEEKVVSTTLNPTGARDHVPEVERQIQVTRNACDHTMPTCLSLTSLDV